MADDSSDMDDASELDDDTPRLPGLSPIEWFFGSRAKAVKWIQQSPIPWSELETLGWQGEYVDAAEYGDVPAQPGVYVLAHEVDSRTLYVGQSLDLSTRIRKDRHSKIKALIALYESAHAGYHNRADPASEIRVFFKTVEPPYPALSLSQTLLWYESAAVGLLCPLAQGNTERLEAQSIQLGRDFF